MKILKMILSVSLVINLLLLSGVTLVIYKKGGIGFIEKQISTLANEEEFSPYYHQKISIYQSSNIEDIEAAMVGDSITDHGEWNELFPGKTVLNRGVSDDDTKGVLNRLDEIIEKKPSKVFIMIGINDFLHGLSKDETLRNYNEIINTLSEKLPSSSIYIQSILPVNNDIYGTTINNSEVKKLNIELEKLAEDKQIVFIDLYSNFLNNNQLDKKFTYDGIHLNGDGYLVWKNSIKEYIE